MVEVALEPEEHEKYSKVIELPHLARIYQTENYLAQSRSGNIYPIVPHDYEASSILVEPMPNRKTETLKEATLKLLSQAKQK